MGPRRRKSLRSCAWKSTRWFPSTSTRAWQSLFPACSSSMRFTCWTLSALPTRTARWSRPSLRLSFSPLTVACARCAEQTLSARTACPWILDRLLIIRTSPYNLEEMAQVIALRAKTEGIEVESDALVSLSQIGERATLRYAVQLLTPASIVAKTNGRSTIAAGDVEECDNMFFDAKSSAKHLSENADKYIS